MKVSWSSSSLHLHLRVVPTLSRASSYVAINLFAALSHCPLTDTQQLYTKSTIGMHDRTHFVTQSSHPSLLRLDLESYNFLLRFHSGEFLLALFISRYSWKHERATSIIVYSLCSSFWIRIWLNKTYDYASKDCATNFSVVEIIDQKLSAYGAEVLLELYNACD